MGRIVDFKTSPQILRHSSQQQVGFPAGSDSEESACNAEDSGSIPGSGRSLGEGNS